jgi:hypothetical protein
MRGAYEGDNRDRDTIERELRLLASVRDAYRERGKDLPSITPMDALLDELIELDGCGKHRWGCDDSAAKPSLWS